MEHEYDNCWLRYEPIDSPPEAFHRLCSHAYVSEGSRVLGAVREELRRGLSGLLGRDPHLWQHPPRTVEGFLAIGTPNDMDVIAGAVDEQRVADLDDGGYLLTTGTWEGVDVLVVTASSDSGLLYGTFDLLRRLSTGERIDDLHVIEEPRTPRRLINHWDNPFRGTVERGYAGQSIFDIETLPDLRDRYTDYARLLASVGINGVVINNVNTEVPDCNRREGSPDAVDHVGGTRLLESRSLEALTGLAALFRRYGISLHLSVNFAAPEIIGGLDTADPNDPAVADWWAQKAEEIYDLIPDFGGFLVKADSEGQPGPYNYDADHVDGANVLAEALAPHGGRVWWRAFVYDSHQDRSVQQYDTFEPLDGAFHDNVTVQVKNGPIDFQPREPVSPVIGRMPDTSLGIELQIAGEYTGQQVHACYHVPMWKDVLTFDTDPEGSGPPVKDCFREAGTSIAGVSNIGADTSWTGHYLAQANLYGFGRLAWDPDLDTETITDEWATLTFGDDPEVVGTVTDILQRSYPALLNYMTGGLGLLHMMYSQEAPLENHYNPAPDHWPEYTGATDDGIGKDRTSAGNGFSGQYADYWTDVYDDPETCPEELVLFFHHLAWDETLSDGRTVVQTLYDNCYAGVEEAARLRDAWATLEGDIDDERHRHVAERLDEQVAHAGVWRDELCEFFYEHAGIPDEHGRVTERSAD